MRSSVFFAFTAILAPGCNTSALSTGAADMTVAIGAVAGPSPSAVLAACVSQAACQAFPLGATFVSNLPSCIGAYAQATGVEAVGFSGVTPAQVTCLAAAGADCAAVWKCVNGGQAPAPCMPADTACANDVAVQCIGGRTWKQDCAALDRKCEAPDFGSKIPGCYVGRCTGAEPSTCDGDLASYCAAAVGLLQGLDCRGLGASCVAGSADGCVGAGPACNDTSSPNGSLSNGVRCEGDVLVRCLGHREARADCTATGQHCVKANGAFHCALGNACDPLTQAPTCTGGKLAFCGDGVRMTVDCVASGFKNGCTTDNQPRCVP